MRSIQSFPNLRLFSSQHRSQLWSVAKLLAMVVLCLTGCGIGFAEDRQTATADIPLESLDSTLHNRLLVMNVGISQRAPSVNLFSKRGDVHFFLGNFAQAVADYQEMVKLDPTLESSHWRLGIAQFYAGNPKAAAAQFDRYHGFDNVDRENGIWRYFSHARAYGTKAARQELLKYEKDDREPFGDLYQLFSGTLKADAILDHIRQAKISDEERQKRMFYADLYIGLNEMIEGRPEAAKDYLQLAVENRWARSAGFGPEYMWHVGRLQLDLLNASDARQQSGQ